MRKRSRSASERQTTRDEHIIWAITTKGAIEDASLVEARDFTYQMKFAAHATLASLRYFRELSDQLGIPMAGLQPHHVIADLQELDRRQREHLAEGGFEAKRPNPAPAKRFARDSP